MYSYFTRPKIPPGTIVQQSISLTPIEYRGVIKMMWEIASVTLDHRMLSGYFVYYMATEHNVTYLAGRDACNE